MTKFLLKLNNELNLWNKNKQIMFWFAPINEIKEKENREFNEHIFEEIKITPKPRSKISNLIIKKNKNLIIIMKKDH